MRYFSLFLALLVFAGCDSDPLAPSSAPAALEQSAENLALKGKPPKSGSPVVHHVSVRLAEQADREAWEDWTAFTYETLTTPPPYHLGTTSSAPAVTDPADYFGCPLAGVTCFAIDIEVSGYAASDLIRLGVFPVNADPDCDGTVAVVPGGSNDQSCAHDASLGSSRRSASLFVGTRATPMVRFGDMVPSGSNASFTFLWQGQHSTGSGVGLVRSFYADLEPGGPDAFRFQAYRQNQGGSGLSQVDCLFGPDQGTYSPCIAGLTGALPSGHVLAPTYEPGTKTVTTGRGKKRTTVTINTLEVGAESGAGTFTYAPDALWAVFLHEESATNTRELVSAHGSAALELPADGCHTYKPIEIELFEVPVGAEDYALDHAVLPVFVYEGSVVESC